MTLDEVATIVKQTISDTFDVPMSDIKTDTVAEDVDGWDSLQHTILMVRLQNRLGHPVPEQVAAAANTVGELIAGIHNALPH